MKCQIVASALCLAGIVAADEIPRAEATAWFNETYQGFVTTSSTRWDDSAGRWEKKDSTDKSTFFDKNNAAVIAYGDFFADTSSDSWAGKPEVLAVDEDGWAQVEVPLRYHDETRKPTHIIISFAASKLGDYFTGSSKSRLWIDDVSLVY